MSRRCSGGTGAGRRPASIESPAADATAASATPHSSRSRRRLDALRSATATGVGECAIQASSRITSPAFCHRSSGFLARHLVTRWSSSGGASGWSWLIAGGSRSRMAAITLAALLPSNARLPVVIS